MDSSTKQSSEQKSGIEHLFSYGTLQPDHAPEEIAGLVGKLQKVGTGSVRGRLYDLGPYPGALLDSSGTDRVFGTVFRLVADSRILRALDQYEEFDPQSPANSLFVRRPVPVLLSNGRTLQCWIYEYNRDPNGARLMESGTYAR